MRCAVAHRLNGARLSQPQHVRPPCRHWPIVPHVPIAVVPAARGTRALRQKTTPRIAGFYGARLSQPQHVARQTGVEIIPNRFLLFHPLRARHPLSGKNARRRCSRCCCAWDTRAPSETQAAILVPEKPIMASSRFGGDYLRLAETSSRTPGLRGGPAWRGLRGSGMVEIESKSRNDAKTFGQCPN